MPGILDDRSRRALGLTAAGLIAFLALQWLYVNEVGALPGERALFERVGPGQLWAPLTNLAQIFANIGLPIVAVPLVLTIGAILRTRVALDTVIGLLATSAAGLAAYALKHLLGPSPLLVELGRTEGGYPSGHAAFGAAFFGFLALLALERDQRDLAVVAAVVGLLVGLAQVFLQAHLVSEVLAGYALGLAWLMLVVLAVSSNRSSTAAEMRG